MEHNELLKLLRKERNFTQEKLAEGISHRNTLSSFENGGI
ncbi:helix-turn-helix domain-containing protein, partial [Enterococcus thailandicus]